MYAMYTDQSLVSYTLRKKKYFKLHDPLDPIA